MSESSERTAPVSAPTWLTEPPQQFATPGDTVSHLGPRSGIHDEGPLTLCGLFLSPMTIIRIPAHLPRRRCPVCDGLS